MAPNLGSESLNQDEPSMVGDGQGGVYVGFDALVNSVGEVRVQRLNGDGQAQWAPDGVVVAQGSASRIVGGTRIAAAAQGTVLVTWLDNRNYLPNFDFDVYVQKLDANGNPLWASGGVRLSTTPVDELEFPRVVGDPAGGALVSWLRAPNPNRVVAVQRISSIGSVAGTTNGATPFGAASAIETDLVADGLGSAFLIATLQFVPDTDIDYLRFDLTTLSTTAVGGGSTSVLGTNERRGRLVADGAGGAFLAYIDERVSSNRLYVQRFAPSGTKLWPQPQPVVSFATGQGEFAAALEPLSGDVLVVWNDGRTTPVGGTSLDVYAQRFNPSGSKLWRENGIPITDLPLSQTGVRIAPTPEGGAVVLWLDDESGPSVGLADVFAQSIAPDGRLQWGSTGTRFLSRYGSQIASVPVYASPGELLVPFEDYYSGNGDVRVQRLDLRHGFWGQPAGRLASLDDVPNDQGSYLRASWLPSDHDRVGLETITHYSVWRATVALGRVAEPISDLLVEAGDIRLGFQGSAFRYDAAAGFYWEYVGQQAAAALPGYGYSVPTTANGIEHSVQIIAHTTDPFVNFPSQALQATSIDNLAPAAPLALNGRRTTGSEVALGWLPSGESEPDFARYEVYRAAGSMFDLGSATLVAAVADTNAIDSDASPGLVFTYAVAAVDVNGNVSEISNTITVDAQVTGIGDAISVSRLLLRPNVPNPFSGATRLRFALPHATAVEIDVFDLAGRRVQRIQRALAAGWHDLPFDARDDRGRELATGTYMVRVRAGEEVAYGRITLVR